MKISSTNWKRKYEYGNFVVIDAQMTGMLAQMRSEIGLYYVTFN